MTWHHSVERRSAQTGAHEACVVQDAAARYPAGVLVAASDTDECIRLVNTGCNIDCAGVREA